MDALSAAARLAALERESPLAARLAEAACLAVRVDAGLLRRLRQALLPEADPGAESDLWFSAIVESRGSTGFQLAGSVLPLLRQRLQADPARLAQAAAITREAHAGAAAAIRLEEALTMLALGSAGPGLPTIDDAAAAELEPALRTLAHGGDAALAVARWAVRAAGRLDERVRRTRAAQTLLLAASLRLGMRRTLADPARADLPLDLLARALPAGGVRRRVGVVQVAGGLQFRTPDDGIASFEAPATDPLLVGLSWRSGGIAHERTVEVLPLAVVRLDGEPDEVTLTTLAGDRYRLGSAQGDDAQATAGPKRPDARWLAACLRLAPPDGGAAPRSGFIAAGGLGLTVVDRRGSAGLLVDARSGRQFELAARAPAWRDEPRDELGDKRLVALWPVDAALASQVTLPIGQALPDHAVAARVAGHAGDGALRWFDVVVQPRSSGPRTALLPTAAGLGDAPQTLAGAPLVDASGAVAAVLAAEALADGSSGVRLTLVETGVLNDALLRANRSRSGARRRVVVVALIDEFDGHFDAVAQALRAAGHEVERVDGSLPLRLNLADIDNSDVFVGLVGWQSGVVPDEEDNPARKPLVQRAYERARERGLPCLMALSRRDGTRARSKARDNPNGIAAFRERLKREMPVIEFDDPTALAAELVAAVDRLPRRSTITGPALQVRVVHGDIREAPSPLLVGHYEADGICGVERQLDERLGGQLSQRLMAGLYPGAVGVNAQVRRSPTDGPATPAVLVVGLGLIGDLSPALLRQTLLSALLSATIEPAREPAAGAANLQASSLLIGSGEGGVGVAASAIAIVEAALRANASLAASPTGARYRQLTIVEAVAERAAEALSALQRWAAGAGSAEAVHLAPKVERRKPPKDVPRGDWWHRLRMQADDRGALTYTLTAGGRRVETVPDERRRLADGLLASAAERADKHVPSLRTLSELLMPSGLFSPLLMVDRLALQLDDVTAAYPWELMDPDRPSRGMPPLAARLGLVRQFTQPARPAAAIDAVNAAAVFAADAGAAPGQPASALTQRMVQDVAGRLARAGLKAPSFVNLAAADLTARLHGEPPRLLHLVAPMVLADTAGGGGFQFGPELRLTAAEIAQMRHVPQLVFASDSGHDGSAFLMKDWPAFAAVFAQELLRIGVRAVVMPGWPLEPRDANGFAAPFYDALVRGLSFGDCVLFARGEAWKRNPKSLAWAAYQCWGNPGLTLMPARDRRSAR